MLFNFQGPCTFNKFFACFSSALFILPHSKAFVKTFFKLFQKVFWAFCELAIQKSICAFTHFLLFAWLKNRLNTGFLNPYSLSFSPLSRDSFIILPHSARNVNTFFEFFSFFLRFFYFHFSLPIYRIFSINFI